MSGLNNQRLVKKKGTHTHRQRFLPEQVVKQVTWIIRNLSWNISAHEITPTFPMRFFPQQTQSNHRIGWNRNRNFPRLHGLRLCGRLATKQSENTLAASSCLDASRSLHWTTQNLWKSLGFEIPLLVGFFFHLFLKNMRTVKLDHETPRIGVKIKHIWNHHPVFSL